MTYLRMIFSLFLLLISCRSEPLGPSSTGNSTDKPVEVPAINWMVPDILYEDNPEPIPESMIMIFMTKDNAESEEFGKLFKNDKLIETINSDYYPILFHIENFKDFEIYEQFSPMSPCIVIFNGRDVPDKKNSKEFFDTLVITSAVDSELILEIFAKIHEELKISGYVSTEEIIKIAEQLKDEYENKTF